MSFYREVSGSNHYKKFKDKVFQRGADVISMGNYLLLGLNY